MWTEATEEIKKFLAENKIKMYTTEYFPKKGKKKWTVVTRDGKQKTFEQDFDFSFFDKK